MTELGGGSRSSSQYARLEFTTSDSVCFHNVKKRHHKKVSGVLIPWGLSCDRQSTATVDPVSLGLCCSGAETKGCWFCNGQ